MPAVPPRAAPAGSMPDAAPANWVDRWAPAGARPWLRLGRLDRPAGAWLLLLPAWWGVALAGAEAHAPPDLSLLARMAAGALLMRAAGCAYNDVVDRDIDARVARTAARPVASGAISVRGAAVFTAACCAAAFFILLSLTRVAIMLGVGSLALVAAYPFMKRITWWPQAWLGLTFNWGALLGYAAVAGRLALAPALLYAAGVFWTLGYDTIYAVQDLEDDALAGVKSSARRLGPAAPRGVLIFYALCVVLAASAMAAAGLKAGAFAAVAVFAVHLAWQARTLDLASPARALALFKANRDAGLILFAGLALRGSWPRL